LPRALAERRRALTLGALALSIALAACGSTAQPAPTRKAPWPGSAATHPGGGPSHLAVARDTAVLPLNLLVAESDDRIVSISPRGQVVWGERQADPGAVFVSRTGRTETIAEPAASVVVLRRIDSGAVALVYGRRGLRLSHPQTAVEDRAGEVVIADSGNCRVVFATQSSARATRVIDSAHGCPQSVLAGDGALVVTLRNPAGIAILAGTRLRRIPLRGLRAPSDAVAFGAGEVVVAQRTNPGRVLEIDRTGAIRWSYGPRSGPGRLDRPALASVLPDGDVLVVDTGNDRVLVIDPRSERIVWQYGHEGAGVSRPGFLDHPTSATLVPLGGV
jgi:DNA-binding beta-propeller fold protein YncE